MHFSFISTPVPAVIGVIIVAPDFNFLISL
jgi:hypothetical protein